MNKTAFNSRNSLAIALLLVTLVANSCASRASDYFIYKNIRELELEETVQNKNGQSLKEHLHSQQDSYRVSEAPIVEYTPTLTDDQSNTVVYGSYFMTGFNADAFWVNTSNCFYYITNFTYLQIPTYEYNTTMYTDFLDQSLFTTTLIQNASNLGWVCNDMAQNMYLWGNYKIYQFGTTLDFATAFFQNLLSKVISINNIYNSITSNQQSGDLEGVYYDMGRLIRVLINFEPVETASLMDTLSQLISSDQPPDQSYANSEEQLTENALESKNYWEDQHAYGYPEHPDEFRTILSYEDWLKQEYPMVKQEDYTDLLTITGGLYLAYGIANGTTLATTPNMTQCQNAFYYIYQGAVGTYDQINSNFTIYGIMLGVDMSLDITYHFYDVNYACYYGLFEAQASALEFGYFASDPSILLYTLGFNIGLLYEYVKNIVFFFYDSTYTRADTTYELGYDMGAFLYYLLVKDSIY